jgi:AraC-like DNA-binding protein
MSIDYGKIDGNTKKYVNRADKTFNDKMNKIIKKSSRAKTFATKASEFIGRKVKKQQITPKYLITVKLQKQIAQELKKRTIGKTVDILHVNNKTRSSSLKDVSSVADIFDRYELDSDKNQDTLFTEVESILSTNTKEIIEDSANSLAKDATEKRYLIGNINSIEMETFIYNDRINIIKEFINKAATPTELEFVYKLCNHLSKTYKLVSPKDIKKLKNSIAKKANSAIRDEIKRYDTADELSMTNIKEMVSLVSICQENKVSISSPYKKIHKYFNTALNDWVNSLKLQKLDKLMRDNPAIAEEILIRGSEGIHYLKSKHFDRLFNLENKELDVNEMFPYKTNKQRIECRDKYIVNWKQQINSVRDKINNY